MAPDEQLQRELQLLVQRHAEFSRRLESILAEVQGSLAASPAISKSAPPPLVPDLVRRELSQLNDRLARMEEQVDGVTRQLGLNSARIQEILDSRTWKLITATGGILLRLVGRR